MGKRAVRNHEDEDDDDLELELEFEFDGDPDDDPDDDFEDDLDEDFDTDFDESGRGAGGRGVGSRGKVRKERPLKSWSDRAVLQAAEGITGPECLVVLTHGTRLASELRQLRPDLRFSFFTTEHFFARTLNSFHSDAGRAGGVSIYCASDPPPGVFQTILFPTLAGDSSEVAQELFQSLHTRLVPGGRLIVSTNAAKGHWIDTQLKSLCSRVEQQKFPRGHVFTAWKSAELKKLRGFRARYDFRHLDRVLVVETRPGVFSHRRLDGGARALIRALSLVRDGLRPGQDVLRIVEMGCGGGAVSAAAAVSFPAAEVLAIDSDARAVECTAQTAKLNNLLQIRTQLDSEGQVPDAGQWDLLLGNPPYYSDFRIAELFLQTARRALRPGGQVLIVTKPVEWQEARMKQLFQHVQAHKFGEYTVFFGVAKGVSG
jgi:16S rRNA (guanine1207-N2)-methyltransferase